MKKEALIATVESAPDVKDIAHAVSEPASGIAALLHDEYTWIGLSFAITIALFVRYLVPVINKALDARATKIRDQLEQATRLREEAEALLVSYQAEQEEMLKQAEDILACAKRDAADMRTRAGEELKATLDRRTAQAKEKIARAEAEAVSSIRTRIIDAATNSARTMLTEQSAGAADEQAIARAIRAIELQIN